MKIDDGSWHDRYFGRDESVGECAHCGVDNIEEAMFNHANGALTCSGGCTDVYARLLIEEQ